MKNEHFFMVHGDEAVHLHSPGGKPFSVSVDDAGGLQIQNETTGEVTNLSEELDNKEDAVTIVDIADGAAITLENNVMYRASGAAAALTIALPETIDESFRCAIDFSCGDVATTLVYPDAIVWTGDSLDANGLFVPLHSHRYHVDIWFDGSCVRANASGVIV